MDNELTKYFVNLGAMGILAVMFYYQNNKNAQDYASRTMEQAKDYASKIEAILNVEKGRTEMLVKLVTDNTSQTAINTTVVQALHRRLDKDELDREARGEKL